MRHFLFLILLLLTCCHAGAQNFDAALLEEFNADRNPRLDGTFQFFSNSVTPVAIVAPVGLITYALFKKDSASKHHAIHMATTLAINGILTTIIKETVRRERPFTTLSFVQKESSGGGYSFPSGHTSSAFAIATSLSMSYRRWYVVVPSYLWAGTVGYSRMDLGVHYPTDVIAGAVIGAGSAFLSTKLNHWINHRHMRSRKRGN